MESSDVFSYIGALGAIATVIALIPEKNRMAAFSFLKKILRQVLNFFRKAIKTAELDLRGAFEEDLAIGEEPQTEFTHDFGSDRRLLLVAPAADVSGLTFTISGPKWLKSQTVGI